MKRKYLNKIKSLESKPKIVNIFSEKEIKMIQDLYNSLPETVFNKKQNVRKKAWLPNYNKELDEIYINRIRDRQMEEAYKEAFREAREMYM